MRFGYGVRMRSVHQHLADTILGQPVEQWITDRREAGVTWRAISRDLEDASDGKLRVTEKTIRLWLSDPA